MSSLDLFGNPLDPHKLPEQGLGEDDSYKPEMATLGEEVTEHPPTRHFYGLWIALALTVIALGTQAYNLQVRSADQNRARAENNSVRLLTVSADRGLIVDDTGSILAQNSRSLALAINPQTLPARKQDRQAVYDLLRQKAGISADDIAYIEDRRTKTPDVFAIKGDLTKDESLLYRDYFASTPGVVLQEIPVRSYASLPSLGQLIGYVGRPDTADQSSLTRVGKTGIEKQYDELLAGTPGIQRAEVNAQGEIVRLVPDSTNSDPATGQTLKLSIDSHMQQVVADALTHELQRRTAKFGPLPKLGASAVIMDPYSGAIKAMVSLPDFNASVFAGGISQNAYASLLSDPANPLLNRAIQGQYPSGSTIKPIVATAGLQEGVITANTTMVTPDAITIGNFRFPDWKTHGLTNTRKAIAESNDIFFYAVGGGWADKNFKGLGIDRLNAYFHSFGFGAKTGIDLPGEATGLVPDNTWKVKQFGEKWYIGDTYHSSIGQGYFLTTPLQMASATAAIANGGTLWKPTLAWSTIDGSGKETIIPRTPANPHLADPANVEIVREGMRQTVESGSGHPLNGLKVPSAGKTGTAQFGNEGLLHAWYTGFAPYDHPTIAFAILIEGGGESFYSSVPVAEEILRGIFNEPLAPGQQLLSATDVPTAFTGEH